MDLEQEPTKLDFCFAQKLISFHRVIKGSKATYTYIKQIFPLSGKKCFMNHQEQRQAKKSYFIVADLSKKSPQPSKPSLGAFAFFHNNLDIF